MCGIAGLIRRDGSPDSVRADVDGMVRCLQHRGPDDQGVTGGDGWAIGMARLAIQDTSTAGHQPMRLGDPRPIYNGEIYNFYELRKELAAGGYSFTSGSDTEVVLAAIHRWGT